MNIRKEARDGTIFPWKIPPFPRYVLPQRYSKDQREKDLMIEKVRDPVFKQYIDDGYVRSLSTFFCIPNGDQDIRIVYDMTNVVSMRVYGPPVSICPLQIRFSTLLNTNPGWVI